jgi:hypothetical protein
MYNEIKSKSQSLSRTFFYEKGCSFQVASTISASKNSQDGSLAGHCVATIEEIAKQAGWKIEYIETNGQHSRPTSRVGNSMFRLLLLW